MKEYPALRIFQDLIVLAREAYPTHYDHWVEVYDRMRKLREDDFVPNMGHHDANVDLVLRKIEDEQVGCLNEFEQFWDAGPLFLQIAFSRSWILSNYELLRTTVARSNCQSQASADEYCNQDECFRCKLQRVKREFSIIRMPLAKFEPADLRNKTPASAVKVTHINSQGEKLAKTYPGHGKYHGDIMFENKTGALGWSVSKGKSGEPRLMSRRELSDLLFRVVATDLL